MRASVLLGLSICVALTACPAICQDADAVGGVRARIVGIEIPSIANAPFTAKVLVTWNRPLVGGGSASRKYYTSVARDSQGRVRRETREFISADSMAEPPLRTFTVLDPVSSIRTTCTKATMNCATSAFQARVNLSQDGGALSGGGSNVTHENLGQQTMFGLPVVGTRETATDSQDSTRLAVTHTDVWYSADLQMDLSVDRSNPQLGEVTLKVIDLVRGEPDPSWFAIPSGYQVIGARSR
ncbi:MAG: hypothetical protein WA485_02295 [Candidatus Sulfotelmatobacter sp.]